MFSTGLASRKENYPATSQTSIHLPPSFLTTHSFPILPPLFEPSNHLLYNGGLIFN